MYSIEKEASATLEVKQSKFIAHLVPFHDYEATLQRLKEEHPKARHFVTAYRYLNEYAQIVEHSSDDGEPKGTSGKPSLMVLQGEDLINVGVIVVRYFGGTKLGTGGLVRAYSDAVNLVVSVADRVVYKEQKSILIEVEYSDIRLVEYECQAMNIAIVAKEFAQKPRYTLQAPKEDIDRFLQKLKRVVTLVETTT